MDMHTIGLKCLSKISTDKKFYLRAFLIKNKYYSE
jgi:hypothetical protein